MTSDLPSDLHIVSMFHFLGSDLKEQKKYEMRT